LIGVDPSRLPTPLPDSLLRATRVQMQGRWPWDAVIPLEDSPPLSGPSSWCPADTVGSLT
jgi:hypothetical protein